jgi:hypothetical protein
MEVLIASLLIFFDNQYTKWSEIFLAIAFLASSVLPKSLNVFCDGFGRKRL